MTQQEELIYLQQLVLDASEWRISEGDETDCIRLEVQDRLRRLAGLDTTDETGHIQSVPSMSKKTHLDIKFLDTPKQKRTVRVMIDGHSRCVPIEACLQVPFQKSRTGYKWAIDPNSQWAMDHLVGRCDEGTHQT